MYQFLIDNAQSFYDEYHVDGFRYDQVTIIDDHGGWDFCKQLTGSSGASIPSGSRSPSTGGTTLVGRQAGLARRRGFDAVWSDGLRNAVRVRPSTARPTAFGGDVDMSDIAATSGPRFGPADAWRAVNSVEDHDITYETHDNAARIAHLADGADARSKYAAARSVSPWGCS